MNTKDIALYTSLGIITFECCFILWILYNKDKVSEEKLEEKFDEKLEEKLDEDLF